MHPLVCDRIGPNRRHRQRNASTYNTTYVHRLRLNGNRLHNTNRDHVTCRGTGKIADLNCVISGIGVLQIGQDQLGYCRSINEVAITPPLVSQFRVRQRIAGNHFQCR